MSSVFLYNQKLVFYLIVDVWFDSRRMEICSLCLVIKLYYLASCTISHHGAANKSCNFIKNQKATRFPNLDLERDPTVLLFDISL